MRSERQCSVGGKSQAALSTLDALLRQEDTSIEDVLTSGEALLAARKGNRTDTRHCSVCKETCSLNGMKLSDLIDCLIDDPFPEIDGHNAFLYPFIACEMLTESPAVLDLFFTDHIYLDQLFSFLQKDYLNDTSAAYFATVAMNLLDRNAEELIGYLFVKYDYGMDIVRHIDSRAVHDFLLKLIHCDCPVSQFSLDKLYLLDAMCLCISPDSLDECILNASHVLTDLISNCHDMKGWRVYMAMIMKEKTVAAWCRFAASDREVLSLTVVKLLTAIVNLPDFESVSRINYEDVDRAIRKQLGKPHSPSPTSVTISSLPPILAHLLPLFPTLIDTLKPACSPLFTGRLSQLRIAIVDLVSALSKMSLYEVTETLVETHAISVVVMLFQAQPWASFLHIAFERLVGVVVEGGNMTLRKELIGEAKLMLVLAEIAKNPEEVTGKGKRRKGFMGHVTKISNYLLNSDCIRDLIVLFSSHPDWLSYQSSYLFPQSSLENTKLGTESVIGMPFQEVTNTMTEKNNGKIRGKTVVEIPEVNLEKQIEDQPASPPLYPLSVEFPSDLHFNSFAYWRLSSVQVGDLPPLD